ncbi:MAG: ComEC/Rec2 family competence protein [Candidatus Fimadaptatus sp.]
MRRLIALMLAATLMLLPLSAQAGLTARFIDVGQGDSCLITCDGESMLVDGGTADSSSKLVALLGELGIDSLRYMINTHPHDDHVGGLCGPLSAVGVDAVYANTTDYDLNRFAVFRRITADKGLAIETLAAGDELRLGGASISVLAPISALDDMNDNSLVLMVRYGATSLLLMGDAGAAEEQALMEAGAELDADIIKVGHHGAGSSSGAEFLEQVSPSWAVISVGADNDFAHPHAVTLTRLCAAGARVLRTDENGTITVQSDGRTLEVTAERDAVDADEEEYYIGNVKSLKFHRPDCGTLPAEKNRVILDTREQALSEGYSPCGNCRP